MDQVDFIRMKDGTAEEYHFLEHLESEFNKGLADRILNALQGLAAT